MHDTESNCFSLFFRAQDPILINQEESEIQNQGGRINEPNISKIKYKDQQRSNSVPAEDQITKNQESEESRSN